MERAIFKYFHGECRILFKKGKEQQKDSFTFSNIIPQYIYLTNVEHVIDFDAEEHKAGRFLYFDRLSLAEGPSRRKPYIQFLKDQGFIYTKDIHKVLIKRFHNQEHNSYCTAISDDLYQIFGEMWFALPEKVKIEEKPVEQFSTEAVKDIKVNVLSQQITSGRTVRNNGSTSRSSSGTEVSRGSRLSSGCFTNLSLWIGRILLLLLLLSITFFLWQALPVLGIIAGVSTLFWLISRFFPGFPLRNTFPWLVIGLLIGYLLFSNVWGQANLNPVKTKDGTVREDPPVEHEHEEDGATLRDFRNNKHVEWYDFTDRFFSIDYYTLSSRYVDSREVRESAKYKNLGSELVSYFNQLYKIIIHNDNVKMDSLVGQFTKTARDSSLSNVAIAEMVTTFIQEIEYVLVHDLSCEEVIAQSGSRSFVAEYHESGMECLPGIFGGVQSPYEFVHNLKGDCDTRAVLAYAILTKMNISASVWVSAQYGHSIVGVGLPAGAGYYKEINGVKHYGVELTAKGYRLGMIAPGQVNMNNWDIALYKNF